MFTLDDYKDLAKEEFTKLKWEGGDPRLVLDAKGRLIVVLAGHPREAKWRTLMSKAVELITRAKELLHWSDEEFAHRRGLYGGKPMGNSFGGGRTEPGKLVNEPGDEEILRDLLNEEPFQRMARFADRTFLFLYFF